MKKFKKAIFPIILVTIVLVAAFMEAEDNTNEIIFGDAGWDSIQFHNAVAGLIAEEVFDYTWRELPASTAILHEGILYGEVDVHMEMWTDNISSYEKDLSEDLFKEVGVNFDDNKQGLYVPRYVIEGDEERGIEPMAPDLKYVWDLLDYKDVFEDEEQSTLGRIYGATPGYEADTILYNKYLHYGLDEKFRYFRPGSDAALNTAFSSAYERGEAIVGYNWEPTWLMGLYDLVLLEDEPYDPDKYEDGKTELPSTRVTIGTSNKFYENEEHKDFIEFLSRYNTSSDLTSSALAHIQETDDDVHETAIWFLRENDYLLDEWLNKEDSEKMRDFLYQEEDR